jgi:uncharacterized protein (TIGR03083 family)
MNKDEGWQAVDTQRTALADLLDTLGPHEWATPSLCEGWTVREVAAHLSMAATVRTGQVLRYVARARGSFDRMIHDTAVDRAGARSTEQIVADLRAVVGSRRLAPGTFWRDPLLDIVVHGQDIARPLGLDLVPPLEATRTSVEWVWQRRFPFFPAQRLRGLHLTADDVAWQRGTGPAVRGPVLALLLVSTGPRAGLAELSGPGLTTARARVDHHARTSRTG